MTDVTTDTDTGTQPPIDITQPRDLDVPEYLQQDRQFGTKEALEALHDKRRLESERAARVQEKLVERGELISDKEAAERPPTEVKYQIEIPKEGRTLRQAQEDYATYQQQLRAQAMEALQLAEIEVDADARSESLTK